MEAMLGGGTRLVWHCHENHSRASIFQFWKSSNCFGNAAGTIMKFVPLVTALQATTRIIDYLDFFGLERGAGEQSSDFLKS